jgi:hypothetical protein
MAERLGRAEVRAELTDRAESAVREALERADRLEELVASIGRLLQAEGSTGS